MLDMLLLIHFSGTELPAKNPPQPIKVCVHIITSHSFGLLT